MTIIASETNKAELAQLHGDGTGEIMGNTTEIVTRQDGAVVHQPQTVEAAIAHAIVSGEQSPENLSKMLDLYERMDAKRAAQEFNQAISDFKVSCPPVVRRTINGQFTTTNRDGVQVNRKYASLEDIEATVRGPLGAHGLSYRWGEAVVNEQMLTLECIVSHVGGHSVSSKVTLPYASKAGCSDQQKMGAAMTYAQRYSLIAALGLTSCDEDIDANESSETVTESQAANLLALADEVNADLPKFLKYYQIERLEDMPQRRFKNAIQMLERKRKQ